MALCWAHVGLKTPKRADPFFIDFPVPWTPKSPFLTIFGKEKLGKNVFLLIFDSKIVFLLLFDVNHVFFIKKGG